MPIISTHRRGCDCKNEITTPFTGNNADKPCCDACGDFQMPTKPCKFVAVFECNKYTQTGERVAIPELPLWKSCIRECTWQSWWGNGINPLATNPDSRYDTPLLAPAIRPRTDINIGAFGDRPARLFCSWGEWFLEFSNYFLQTGDIVDGELPDLTTLYSLKWELKIEEGNVAFILNANDGATALYQLAIECAFNQWPDMTLHLISAEGIYGLPNCLCIRASDSDYDEFDPVFGLVEYRILTACTEPDGRCKCLDSGIDPLTMRVSISGCDEYSFSGYKRFSRYLEADWPHVTFCDTFNWPGAACGVLWSTFTISENCTSPYSGSAAMALWCDGETWVGKAYCYRSDTTCWEEQGDLTITVSNQCGGVDLAIVLPTMACCCPGVPDCTCTPPSTLYVDTTGCDANWTGSGIAITFDGVDTWLVAGLGISAYNAIELTCTGDQWVISFSPNNASCDTGITAAASGTCDPFYLEFSVPLDSVCCGPSGGTLTVVVSE